MKKTWGPRWMTDKMPDQTAALTVGYTAGVYDLFHIGHLKLLERAKAQCDHLVVGVTSDQLASSRKGQNPFVPLDERLEIIRALRCVDQVVVQEDMDKFAAWQRIGFQVMFVGDDWKGHPRWVELEQRFAKVDVRITYFPYTTHVSSTRLRAILKKIENAG